MWGLLLPKSEEKALDITRQLLSALSAAHERGVLHRDLKPANTDRDVIVIGDFVNTTGDAAFDDTLKQALAAKLQESPFLNVFSDERARETLLHQSPHRCHAKSPAITRQIHAFVA